MLTISERMGYDWWEGDITHKREKLSFYPSDIWWIAITQKMHCMEYMYPLPPTPLSICIRHWCYYNFNKSYEICHLMMLPWVLPLLQDYVENVCMGCTLLKRTCKHRHIFTSKTVLLLYFLRKKICIHIKNETCGMGFNLVRSQECHVTDTKMMLTSVHSNKKKNQKLSQVTGQLLLWLYDSFLFGATTDR